MPVAVRLYGQFRIDDSQYVLLLASLAIPVWLSIRSGKLRVGTVLIAAGLLINFSCIVFQVVTEKSANFPAMIVCRSFFQWMRILSELMAVSGAVHLFVEWKRLQARAQQVWPAFSRKWLQVQLSTKLDRQSPELAATPQSLPLSEIEQDMSPEARALFETMWELFAEQRAESLRQEQQNSERIQALETTITQLQREPQTSLGDHPV